MWGSRASVEWLVIEGVNVLPYSVTMNAPEPFHAKPSSCKAFVLLAYMLALSGPEKNLREERRYTRSNITGNSGTEDVVEKLPRAVCGATCNPF